MNTHEMLFTPIILKLYLQKMGFKMLKQSIMTDLMHQNKLKEYSIGVKDDKVKTR